ncbi:MAG: enoyl-CoA hydratase [Acidimicrobiaceae bacterium]|nr:enoyl-CoA hydratase [Acidimicrobiaceae bacterium]HAB59022.1 enoyl-CoA hydratase [Acidimicrobiaceae bacterium]
MLPTPWSTPCCEACRDEHREPRGSEPMTDPVVRSEIAGGVCTVTLDDPERKNALSAQLTSELMDALDAAEADDAVRVIVLTNTGNTFCAGANLSERSGRSEASSLRPVDPAEMFARFGRSAKPYVGKINGHCVAGGMGLAAAMDYSVVVDTAKMGFTEVRIGVAPAMISVLCLPKMRASDARAAFLRGNRFLAPEAERMGIINRAAAADEIDAIVDEVVGDLVKGSPAALAATKQLLANVPNMTTDDAFAWTAPLSADLFKGDDAREGMGAFLEKRPASWIPQEHH